MHLDHFSLPVPQLSQEAVIHVFLPDAYDAGAPLPVFYMNDGQYVFGKTCTFDSSLSGLDFLEYYKTMQAYVPDIIIVAVEAAKTRFGRMARYLPVWNYSDHLNATYGADFVAHGKEFADWIAHDLKSYIDSHYRTLPEAEHTGIGGLSASCIFSSYTAGRYSDTYSKLLILSPSVYLWWDALKPLYDTLDYSKLDAFFSFVGTNETGRITQANHFICGSKLLEETMLGNGLRKDAMLHITQPGGEHNGTSWQYFFPEGLRYIFRPQREKF